MRIYYGIFNRSPRSIDSYDIRIQLCKAIRSAVDRYKKECPKEWSERNRMWQGHTNIQSAVAIYETLPDYMREVTEVAEYGYI